MLRSSDEQPRVRMPFCYLLFLSMVQKSLGLSEKNGLSLPNPAVDRPESGGRNRDPQGQKRSSMALGEHLMSHMTRHGVPKCSHGVPMVYVEFRRRIVVFFVSCPHHAGMPLPKERNSLEKEKVATRGSVWMELAADVSSQLWDSSPQ